MADLVLATSVAGATGSVRGSLTRPRGGRTRRPRSAARGFATEAGGTGSARPLPQRHEHLPAQAEGSANALGRGLQGRPGRSGRSVVKRVSLLCGNAEEIERFESSARGVGRLLHIVGETHLVRRDWRAPRGGQVGQLRGELPPEDAGEKGPCGHKGAKVARGNCKGNMRTLRPLERRTTNRREALWVRKPSFAPTRRAEGTAPGEEELEARRKTGEGGRRGRWSSITRQSSSRQRAPEALGTPGSLPQPTRRRGFAAAEDVAGMAAGVLVPHQVCPSRSRRG